MGQEGSRKTREKGGFPGGGNITLRARGTFPYGHREHITMDGGSVMLRVEGKAVFLEHKNALGTTNALFYFLGRGGGWATVKLGFTSLRSANLGRT